LLVCNVQPIADMKNRIKPTFISLGCLLPFAVFASDDTPPSQYPESASIYEKPFTNLFGKWSNEVGFTVPILTDSPVVVKLNMGYIQSYPLKWDDRPQFSTGAAVVYEFTQSQPQVVPGLYTKVRYNLLGLWQQESGFTARTRMGQCGLVFNAGYVLNYPVGFHYDAQCPNQSAPIFHGAAQWQVGLSLNFYFK